jgi:hypothetical protein
VQGKAPAKLPIGLAPAEVVLILVMPALGERLPNLKHCQIFLGVF